MTREQALASALRDLLDWVMAANVDRNWNAATLPVAVISGALILGNHQVAEVAARAPAPRATTLDVPEENENEV